MELFKLLGTIAVENDTANKAINETTDTASSAEGKLSTAFTNIGSFAVKAGKVIATGLAAGATAIGGLVKSAVSEFSEYQQLIGGAQTLFGESAANSVINKAVNAYTTAGMSANDYLSTVTSFSASLIQSLDNDTQAAVDYADMAITDMSDNANKMGTDISMIQNAYQGFAKQNYTMLDNLKLGYGGTKEEMERLIVDAAKLSDEFSVATDANGDLVYSYADIVDAIHIVQDNMGITGATAQEASTTIEGSLKSTKAAWTNMLTSLSVGNGEYAKSYTTAFIDSALIALENLKPRIITALNSLSTVLETLMPVIAAELPVLMEELLPGLISGATALLTGLITALPGILQILIEQLPSIVTQVGDALVATWPVLLESVKSLAGQIWDYVVVDLLGSEMDFETAMSEISGWLTETFAPVINILSQAADGAKDAWSDFVEQAGTAWETTLKPCLDTIISLVTETFLPTFQDVFENTIKPLVSDCFESVQVVWETILSPVLQTIGDFLSGTFATIWSDVFSGANEMLGALTGTGQDLFEKFSEYFPAIQETVSGVFDQIGLLWSEFLKPCFDEIVDLIVNVLAPAFDDVFTSYITDYVSTCFEAIQGFWETICKPVFDIVKEAIGSVKDVFAERLPEIAEFVSSCFSDIQAFWENNLQPCFEAIGNFIETVLAPVFDVVFNTLIWSAVDTAFAAIKNLWEDTLKPVFTGITDFLTGVFTLDFDLALNGLLEIATGVFNGILTAIETPMNAGKEIVENAVQFIKDKFDFDWSFPDIKLPHFSVSGGQAPWGFGGKGYLPSVSVEWYAKAMNNAMLLDEPTLFGQNSEGQFLGAGEAGQEVVAGAQTLMNMIGDTVDAKVSVAFDRLCRYMEEAMGINQEMLLALREGHVIKVNERELARTVKTYA